MIITVKKAKKSYADKDALIEETEKSQKERFRQVYDFLKKNGKQAQNMEIVISHPQYTQFEYREGMLYPVG